MRWAYWKPARIAPPTPRFRGRSSTATPAARAMSAVASVDPSDTTRMSAKDGFSTFTDSKTSESTSSSFHAGMTIRRRESALGRDTQ